MASNIDESETPDIREYPASGIVVTWEAERCQHVGYCVRGLPQVFNTKARPWIDANAAGVEDLVAQIDQCPNYALGYRTDDGRVRTAPAD